MTESREDHTRTRLAALDRRPRMVPEQAHAVGFTARRIAPGEADTDDQREVADAAARTAVATEIEERWPGLPYVIRHGSGEELHDIVPDCDPGDRVVLGIVYRLDR
ncbi:hypothetical protein ACFOVU_11180 [Nocardiopsis sediminis]|uniref:DUF4258 domain-containing protein n=1 Tax=Nocardiopsis sediminis TaxID=1778267 RepID=A0ABV8FP18_9ACTN